MKKDSTKMYIKEYTSKLEFYNNKKLVKLHNKIKSKRLKKIYNFIIIYIINIKFFIKFIYSNPIIKKIDSNSFYCILPTKINNVNNNKFTLFLYNRCINNIKRILNNYNVKYVILSKQINKLEEIKNICNLNNIEILKGKYLFKIMILDVIKYILKIRNEEIQSQVIHILVNKDSKINLELIEYIASNVKSLNIITNRIKSFQKVEKYLYEKQGIMIVVANNKRKSLRNSKIIINIDLNKDEIINYQINRNAIIINLSKNIIKMEKSFSGIIINLLEMQSLNLKNLKEYNYYLFKNIEFYESKIIDINKLETILKKIKEDGILIEDLIGERGKIERFEYKKIA